jgi:aryl-alcohol dehydrogenase-like predicted oxidoreductase
MPRSPKLTPPELGLGTVQFGLQYGVSNTSGQTSLNEAREILYSASSYGIRYLDTARAYGSSEQVVGQLTTESSEWKIITKLPPLPDTVTDTTAIHSWVRESVEASLQALNRRSVYGVLAHNTHDAVGPCAPAIFEGLLCCVRDGLATKIGASIYDRAQLEHVTTQYPADLVQVPVNIFDQRLTVDNTLSNLRQRGIEIHARSIFLQGLILMQPDATPRYFDPIRQHLVKFQKACEELQTVPVVMALSFLKQLPVDVALVGVNSQQHLEEIAHFYHETSPLPENLNFAEFRLDEPEFINPALWRL